MGSVLIIGGSGYLGGSLVRQLSYNNDVFFTYYKNKPRLSKTTKAYKLDITVKEDVVKLISKLSPKVVIHAAANSDLVFCEENKNKAWDINVIGTKNIAIATKMGNAKLLFLSTDMVFDGLKGDYIENDSPNPVCNYGYTKAEGEKVVIANSKSYVIIRTSVVYGNSSNESKCSVEKLIYSLRNESNINLFYDEYRTPIYVDDLCKVILKLARFKKTQEIYHVCGSEKLSRYQFGLKIASIFGLNKDKIKKVSSNDIKYNQYKRPQDCFMANSKVKNEFSINFLTVDEGLKTMLKMGGEY